MVTLTFETQPANPKDAFDKFTRAFRECFGKDRQWGWIMEYQARGVVHYHIFLGSDFADCCTTHGPSGMEFVVRNGRETSLVRGHFDDWVVNQWIAATGNNSDAFARFQRGGIIELFRTPDAAARYVAKEAGKREQKALPEGCEGGRRWWWLSKAGKAIPEFSGQVVDWPLAVPLSRVFDKSQLAANITNVRPIKRSARTTVGD
jgi:hypothetical protein